MDHQAAEDREAVVVDLDVGVVAAEVVVQVAGDEDNDDPPGRVKQRGRG